MLEINGENNQEEHDGSKSKTCKNENFKEESEFTFQLNSATTADSQRRESHRLTPSRIATGNLRREPPRFVEESHRDSSKIATDSRRGESHRFSMRCEPTILRHGRESPTRFFVEGTSETLRGREKLRESSR